MRVKTATLDRGSVPRLGGVKRPCGLIPPKMAVSLETSSENRDLGGLVIRTLVVENEAFA